MTTPPTPLHVTRDEPNGPHAVMRAARQAGGIIEQGLTRFDAKRGGRVLELRVFWPGVSGYNNMDAKGDND